MAFDVVVQGDVVLPDGVLEGGWVASTGGVITAIGQGAPPEAATLHDHSGMLVLPGLVDGHMHTSSSTGWSGIELCTRSAAAGGVTTCVDMPYDVPLPVTDAALLAQKVAIVNATSHVDVALYGTIRKDGNVEDIAGLVAGGVCSFKFSTYEYDAVRFPRLDHVTMLRAMTALAPTGLMVAIHNEDQEMVERLTAQAKARGETHALMHARTRPPITESLADLEIFEMARETGCHVHIAHSSLARGFDLAAQFRRHEGARTSAEACIHYLCMTEDDLVRLEGFGKCNPPFRTAAEVERMWEAVAAGTVAYVSTDHAPWPRERKEFHGDIFAIGAGLTGLQSFAPLMFTLLEQRGLPVTLMARLCAEQPAHFHGLAPKKGAIRVGADADLVVLERGVFPFDAASIQDREDARWSPYDGMRMAARVAASYLRGAKLWDGERVLATPGTGRFVPRQHGEGYLG